MRGVDLSRHAFDFDLTLSVLAMHPDGTVYHRYGGRDHTSPDVWQNARSYEAFLRAALDAHARDIGDESFREPPAARRDLARGRSLEQVPTLRLDADECIHCHHVYPTLRDEALKRGTWTEDDLWVHPPPRRVGLELDPEDQALVVRVDPDSPAGRAGLRRGDRLVRLGGQEIATATDVSWALHAQGAEAADVAVEYERGDERLEAVLALADGWRRGTPLEFSWRPFKWPLEPMPGFGGADLDAAEKAALGLEPDDFAFRVKYLVTWGDNRRYGQAAGRAGLREGDVVLGAAGTRDFAGHDHFHAWWRLTRAPGETVPVEVISGRARRTLQLELPR